MANVHSPALIGLFLIVFGVLGLVPFIWLGRIFEYPDILRQPTGDILHKYRAGGAQLRLTWLAFAMAFVPLLVIAPLLQDAFARHGVDPTLLTIGTIFAVIGGVFNIVGLLRWVFLVPLLAERYADPNATAATRDTITIVFEAFHTYLGVTIGEFLGFAFAAMWGVVTGAAILSSGLVSPVFGYVAILASIGVLIGDLEFAGWKPAGIVVAISSAALMLWAIALGLAFIVG